MKLPLLYREMVTVSFEWPDVMRRFDRIARYVRLPSSPFSAVAGVQRYKIAVSSKSWRVIHSSSLRKASKAFRTPL